MAGYLFVILLAIANIGLMVAAVFLFKQVKKSGICPVLGEMVFSQLPVKSWRTGQRPDAGEIKRPGFGTKLK